MAIVLIEPPQISLAQAALTWVASIPEHYQARHRYALNLYDTNAVTGQQ